MPNYSSKPRILMLGAAKTGRTTLLAELVPTITNPADFVIFSKGYSGDVGKNEINAQFRIQAPTGTEDMTYQLKRLHPVDAVFLCVDGTKSLAEQEHTLKHFMTTVRDLAPDAPVHVLVTKTGEATSTLSEKDKNAIQQLCRLEDKDKILFVSKTNIEPLNKALETVAIKNFENTTGRRWITDPLLKKMDNLKWDVMELEVGGLSALTKWGKAINAACEKIKELIPKEHSPHLNDKDALSTLSKEINTQLAAIQTQYQRARKTSWWAALVNRISGSHDRRAQKSEALKKDLAGQTVADSDRPHLISVPTASPAPTGTSNKPVMDIPMRNLSGGATPDAQRDEPQGPGRT
ncbi:MAG: hypothetical protein HY939_00385 [Gammaproteobacteria bacterium]|nr:hypothetical protein [Gammaproteobacteria bacterium]